LKLEKEKAPARRNVRRRSAEVSDDDDDDGDAKENNDDNGDTAERELLRRRGKHLFVYDAEDDEMKRKLIMLDNSKEKEDEAWNKLNRDAKNLCVKSVVRLFLMKGARGTVVTRANITEVLSKCDDGNKSYGKFFNPIMHEAFKSLINTFGYAVTNGKYLSRSGEGSKSDFFVVTRLTSPKMQEVLQELQPVPGNDAYIGFVFVVLQTLNTAPGMNLDIDSILRTVRKIDPRFPADSERRGGGSKSEGALAIPDLKDSFSGLIGRMKKDGYISEVKQDNNHSLERAVAVYEMGPRVYLEFGLRRLAKSYFAAKKEVLDMGVYNEALKLEEAILKKVKEEEGKDDD
jgi:hypothetical protein